ncbi:hypothetical protein LguiB_034017 [Lonicera macranthoides]
MGIMASCGYFECIDPPICARSKEIIPGLLRRINRCEKKLERRRKLYRKIIIIFVFIVMIIRLFMLGKN